MYVDIIALKFRSRLHTPISYHIHPSDPINRSTVLIRLAFGAPVHLSTLPIFTLMNRQHATMPKYAANVYLFSFLFPFPEPPGDLQN